MNNKYRAILLIAFTTVFAGCTNYYYKKGNSEFSNLQYHDAIEHYKKVIAKEDNHDAKIKLANCYRLVNDYRKAEKLYAEVLSYPETDPSNMFNYSKMLMSIGEYSDAKIWLKKYLEAVPNDIVAKMLLSSCNSVNEFMRDTTLYTLQNVPYSEFESSFGQVPYGEGIIFTADKKATLQSRQEPWTGKSYYDLYFSERDKDGRWLSPQLLKGEINGRYHEGPATFNNTGDEVYFTRSNYFKSGLKKNSKNENNLKLFKAKLVKDKWTKLEELPFNSDDYSVGHPCLAKDQKTLYFISDMPGGFGGTDVYSVTLTDNVWSKPENMGPEVNTPGNEMFPFIADDGTFYFSSDAHSNYGGLDVFATSYDTKSKKWLQVENLNYPLNSSKDDFAFVIKSDNRTGFVSSNRSNVDNIYEFRKNDPTFNLSGRVTIKGKGLPFAGATITLIDGNVATLTTDQDGRYKIRLRPNTEYTVYGSDENYFSQSVELTTVGEKYSKNYVADFELEKIILEKPIVLENIYYDLDKWNIRPDAAKELDKLVKLLNNNPAISIEMGAHTDSRAGDYYNLVLSDKRAKATVDYLVYSGINVARLKYKGYGETKLVNHCKNNVQCTEAEHQQNRRTEFKVIKITKQNGKDQLLSPSPKEGTDH
jgi:outer membrane protein OmpA-like peptidoglycan-associated protein